MDQNDTHELQLEIASLQHRISERRKANSRLRQRIAALKNALRMDERAIVFLGVIVVANAG